MPILNGVVLQPPGNVLGPAALQQNGPIIEVQVAIPSALEQLFVRQNQPVPPPVRGRALIDTGATMSSVDDTAIRSLGVSPVGLINTGTAGGPQLQSMYPARFMLGVGWTFEFSRVTGSNLTGTGLIALIGRDVLSRTVLVYNGTMGVFSLAI
jgi:hypothetical protein